MSLINIVVEKMKIKIISFCIFIGILSQCKNKKNELIVYGISEIVEKAISDKSKCGDEPVEWIVGYEDAEQVEIGEIIYELTPEPIIREVFTCYESHRVRGYFETFGESEFDAVKSYVKDEGYDLDLFLDHVNQSIINTIKVIENTNPELLENPMELKLFRVFAFLNRPSFQGDYYTSVTIQIDDNKGQTYDIWYDQLGIFQLEQSVFLETHGISKFLDWKKNHPSNNL